MEPHRSAKPAQADETYAAAAAAGAEHAAGPEQAAHARGADLDAFRDRSLNRGVNPLIYWTLRALLVPAFLIYLRMQRIGREHLPKDGPLLLASNHRSFLDPFVIGTLVRRPVYYFAKRELFEKRWQAWILNALGAFPVDRGAGDRAAMSTALEILRRGDCVVVFPEGTRIRKGSLGTPRRGIGRLALEAGVPVVPIAVDRHRKRTSWLADPPAQGAPARRSAAALPERRQLLAEARDGRHRSHLGVRQPAVGVARRRARRRALRARRGGAGAARAIGDAARADDVRPRRRARTGAGCERRTRDGRGARERRSQSRRSARGLSRPRATGEPAGGATDRG